MTLGGLSYVTNIAPNDLWLEKQSIVNILFAQVLIIGTLHYSSGVQSYIENQLLELAIFDGLTGLGNRHYYKNRSAAAFSEANRNKSALSLIVLDIDFFKKVNDSYGHDCGDLALKLIATNMQEAMRLSDSCFRIGGEEFIIIHPGSSTETAISVAERMRETMASTPLIFNKQTINLTASFGVATLYKHADNLDDLYVAADKAMYHAKHSGRNRVEVAG